MSLSPAFEQAYEQWRQETLAIGRQEGRQEGRREGEQQGRQAEAIALVIRQLSRRLGVLPAAVRSQINQLPLQQIEALAEALLDFATQDDLMAWLADQAEPTH